MVSLQLISPEQRGALVERNMMTPDDRAMLAFATKWARFGGGDEYILPEFGVTPVQFYHRVLAMVTTPRTAEVDFATKQFLRQFCLSKIAGFSARTPDVMQGNRTHHCEPEAVDVRSPSASVPHSRTYPPRGIRGM